MEKKFIRIYQELDMEAISKQLLIFGDVMATCSNCSRAYLRHLFLTKEALAVSLATVHNVYFMESLMRQIRSAIKEQRFDALKDEWLPST